MRFTYVAALLTAVVGAAATPVQPRGDLQDKLKGELSDVLGNLKDELANDVAALEGKLEGLFGDLKEFEQDLGSSLAEKLHDLVDSGLPEQVVSTVLQAIAKIKDGVPLDEVNAWLKQATNGVIDDIEETLGIDDIVADLTQ